MEALRLVLVVVLAMALQSGPMRDATRRMRDHGASAPGDVTERLSAVSTPNQEQARDEIPGSFLVAQRTALRSRVRHVPAEPPKQGGLRRICAARGERSPPSEPCSVPPWQDHLRENGSSDAHGKRG
jgi:hypothetical protein